MMLEEAQPRLFENHSACFHSNLRLAFPMPAVRHPGGLVMKRVVLSFAFVLTFASTILPQWTFDRYKPPKPLPNPYTVQATRDQLVSAISQVMEEKSIPSDNQESKPEEGTIVSKAFIFSKGINAKNDLAYFAEVPAKEVREWTKGRIAYTINIQPVDPARSTIAVYARIEGYSQGVLGTEWIECPSNGLMEDQLLRSVLDKLNIKAP